MTSGSFPLSSGQQWSRSSKPTRRVRAHNQRPPGLVAVFLGGTRRNADGEYCFICADVSLLRTVDDVRREIKAWESHINIPLLTTGTLDFGKGKYGQAQSLACVN